MGGGQGDLIDSLHPIRMALKRTPSMPSALSIDAVKSLLPERPDDGHKGTFGHVFIIAGARGFTGAAKLACMAAGRSGVGLVTVGVPYPVADSIAGSLFETMSLRLPATEAETIDRDALESALSFCEGIDAVALGPGLSQHTGTIEFVLEFTPQCPAPLLVDADGLNALSENPSLLNERASPTVLTPHPGEMGRLLHISTEAVQADREAAAKQLAELTQCVVLLKGRGALIAEPGGRMALNPTGNNGLGAGGAGDVLSGLIGGLLAQGMAAYEAACLGAYVHGMAGDFAAERFSRRGMIARDVVGALPEAWLALEAG